MRRLAVAAAALLLAGAPALQGQQNPWKAEGEVGGTVFFGNRDQTQVAARLQFERADSLFETSSDFRFTYGEAEGSNGVKQVNRRSWSAASNLDFRPEERWRPFVSGRLESSFERKIALRYNSGGGVRLHFQRDRLNRVDLAVAILSERTYAREEGGITPDEVSLIRWSSTARIRRSFFEDRLTLDSDNAYQPVFDSFDNFTLRSRTALSYGLSERVALRFSFLSEYDSGAKDRGARTNRDGQAQVTVVVRF